MILTGKAPKIEHFDGFAGRLQRPRGGCGIELSMANATVIADQRQRMDRSTFAVVTTCTHRKRVAPSRLSAAVSLPVGSQSSVITAWVSRLSALPVASQAVDIYAGRGFALARAAAAESSASLYVVSAGLGLVPAKRPIPAYGLTTSLGQPDSIASRITGAFRPEAWFDAMLSGPFSDQWPSVFGRGQGRVLIALTRSYAEMIGEQLASLSSVNRARLRLFGRSLASFLPVSVHSSISPHDDRLDSILPGTKADYPQRALLHFVRTVGDRDGDAASDFALITSRLKRVKAPERPRRPKCTDKEILMLITARLRTETGIARLLRAVRHEDGVACEQTRFTRLYRQALEQRRAA